jgi:DNA topoisomerase-1
VKPQEAHEAIRPTHLEMRNLGDDNDKIKAREKRMYKLIWETTMESCMSPAEYYSITANISAAMDAKYLHTSELLNFLGWKIVANDKSLKDEKENKIYYHLNQLKQGTTVKYNKITCKFVLKNLKQHYTEAKLVQLLEEKGIGRPSTFSSIVDKIQDKAYVKKEDIIGKRIVCKDFELEHDTISETNTTREFGNEKNKLVIQQMGVVVMEFLYKHFNELFNYDYTSQMESALDKIAKGELIWHELCKDCNCELDILIEKIKDETKIEYKIDENNTYLIGKYGPIIKCAEKTDDGREEITFKPVRKDIDVKLLENGEAKMEDIVDTNKMAKSHYILGQYKGNDVILKKGKFGLYISWGENSKTLKELGNRPMENITFDEVKKYLEQGSNLIREINENMSIRRGPKGDYLFYKMPKMKKPQFYDIKGFMLETGEDYKICDIVILKSWISEKYKVYL